MAAPILLTPHEHRGKGLKLRKFSGLGVDGLLRELVTELLAFELTPGKLGEEVVDFLADFLDGVLALVGCDAFPLRKLVGGRGFLAEIVVQHLGV